MAVRRCACVSETQCGARRPAATGLARLPKTADRLGWHTKVDIRNNQARSATNQSIFSTSSPRWRCKVGSGMPVLCTDGSPVSTCSWTPCQVQCGLKQLSTACKSAYYEYVYLLEWRCSSKLSNWDDIAVCSDNARHTHPDEGRAQLKEYQNEAYRLVSLLCQF